jgi:hypothetical protein
MLLFRRFSFNLGFRIIGAVSFLMASSVSSTALEVLNLSRSPTLPGIGGWTPFYWSTIVPPTFTDLYQVRLHCQLQHRL